MTAKEYINKLNISEPNRITLGRINETFSGILNNEKIIIKFNFNNNEILQSELRSLNYLKMHQINTPEIKTTTENYMILEYIDSIKQNKDKLYTELEKLHNNKSKNNKFGFELSCKI